MPARYTYCVEVRICEHVIPRWPNWKIAPTSKFPAIMSSGQPRESSRWRLRCSRCRCDQLISASIVNTDGAHATSNRTRDVEGNWPKVIVYGRTTVRHNDLIANPYAAAVCGYSRIVPGYQARMKSPTPTVMIVIPPLHATYCRR